MHKKLKLSHARSKSMASTNPTDPVEIAVVKLLVDLGFHHKRVAALFDCNQGRIAEISKGRVGEQVQYDFEVSVCQTCKGHGIIGGLYRVGDGDVDGWEEACPDCAPSPRAQALEEAAQALEAWGDIYGDNAAKCVRALSSQPVADGWKEVPAEATQELLADTTKGKQVLAYEDGQYYNAWIEFEPSQGGYLWVDDRDSEPNPTHYRPLPASPGASE